MIALIYMHDIYKNTSVIIKFKILLIDINQYLIGNRNTIDEIHMSLEFNIPETRLYTIKSILTKYLVKFYTLGNECFWQECNNQNMEICLQAMMEKEKDFKKIRPITKNKQFIPKQPTELITRETLCT